MSNIGLKACESDGDLDVVDCLKMKYEGCVERLSYPKKELQAILRAIQLKKIENFAAVGNATSALIVTVQRALKHRDLQR